MSTCQRILEAATRLFAAEGYAGVSMREIAAAAGIRPASLYNHFDSKAALFLAVVRTLLADKHARLIAPVPQDLPPCAQLRRFVEAFARFMAEDVVHARLPLWIMLQAQAEAQRIIVQDLWREEFEWVLARMRRCVADPERALTLTLQLFGLMLFEFAARSLIDQLPVEKVPSAEAEDVAQRVWQAVACQMEEET
ncbi:TetR/AcrR family transcriptional regulator [Sulfurivirga sp.]|uniref:TetR/AcrR family transcriptional regulator n=1 Tax=Sulfurivirga sp. TaxID=2614236 RepID=UPI0025FC5382|nr:TetR/AcrR family transcriptional regulator [Sulfurivirga sp.]